MKSGCINGIKRHHKTSTGIQTLAAGIHHYSETNNTRNDKEVPLQPLKCAHLPCLRHHALFIFPLHPAPPRPATSITSPKNGPCHDSLSPSSSPSPIPSLHLHSDTMSVFHPVEPRSLYALFLRHRSFSYLPNRFV